MDAEQTIKLFLAGPDKLLNVFGLNGVGKTRLIGKIAAESNFEIRICPSPEELGQRTARCAQWYTSPALGKDGAAPENLCFHAPYGLQDVPAGLFDHELPHKWIIETHVRIKRCPAVRVEPPSTTQMENLLKELAPDLENSVKIAIMASIGYNFHKLIRNADKMMLPIFEQHCSLAEGSLTLAPKKKPGPKTNRGDASRAADDTLERMRHASEVKVLHDVLCCTDQSMLCAPRIPFVSCSKCKLSHRGCQKCRINWLANPGEEDTIAFKMKRNRSDAAMDEPKRLPWKQSRKDVDFGVHSMFQIDLAGVDVAAS